MRFLIDVKYLFGNYKNVKIYRKSFMSVLRPTEELADTWIKLYKKNPRTTVTLTLIFMVVAGTTIYVTETRNAKIREERRLENLSFSKQIDKLNSTEANLKELITFIESQKTQLRQSQDLLESLNEEKNQLEPLVEADRKVVEALFEIQAREVEENKWTERWIGFGFGVVSSIVATTIWTICATLWTKKPKVIAGRQPEDPDSTPNS
ncbi:MAG: hypothetical protein AAGA16_19820 [Cyanobacteria bacterium P01_E01_bin.35]